MWEAFQASIRHKVGYEKKIKIQSLINTSGREITVTSYIHRFHLIEDHMNFSPFQCEKCMRVYTRKSLYTRHLKEVGQESKTRRTRQCPHRAVEPDEAFHIRKRTYEALWAIQVTQDQVDNAISVIKQHNNGALPSRRRRTPNINGSEPSEITILEPKRLQIPQPTNHHLYGRDERGKFYTPLRADGPLFF